MRFYRLFRAVFLLIAAPLFRFRVHGSERIPRSGSGIVVAAHRSWLDPACVGGAVRRPVRFLIMRSVYHQPWARWFYRWMGGIPVGPGGSESIGALRAALRLLRQGHLVGVFPEGRVTEGTGLGPLHPGAAMLAVRSGSPIIPLLIRGSAEAWPHGRRWPGPGRVSVVVGSPIEVEPDKGRASVARVQRRIESALREISRVPEEEASR